jgi:hypothetical protein
MKFTNRRRFLELVATRDQRKALKGFTFYADLQGKWIMCPNILGLETFEGIIEEVLNSDEISIEIKKLISYNLDIFTSEYSPL